LAQPALALRIPQSGQRHAWSGMALSRKANPRVQPKPHIQTHHNLRHKKIEATFAGGLFFVFTKEIALHCGQSSQLPLDANDGSASGQSSQLPLDERWKMLSSF
jgi:hypothetical protein